MTRDPGGKQRFDRKTAMDARLWTAAAVAAGSAWLLPAPAHAQIAGRVFQLDARTAIARAPQPRRSAYAVPILSQWRSDEAPGMMRSWALDGGARVGLGRFDITQIARPRTNLERERMPLERRSSSIAGAGVRLAF